MYEPWLNVEDNRNSYEEYATYNHEVNDSMEKRDPYGSVRVTVIYSSRLEQVG